MSKPSINSDYYFNAAILGTVRKLFPTVSEAFLCWPVNEEDIPPNFSRTRSRGRHSPGDGNYWCSTVYYSDDISGYFSGRSFYATSITTKEDRNVNNSSSVTWSHEGCTYTTYYTFRSGGNRWWTQVTIQQYVRPRYEQGSGRLYWTVIRNEGAVSGYRKWDTAYSAAILSTPSTHSTYWVRYLDLSKCTPTPEPDREDRHVPDVIQSGAMPNLDAYLNQAYIEAFKSLPAIETNNIANLMQLFGGLASLVSSITTSNFRLTEIGSLSDAWLGYRYSYSTTKSDIEELVGYVDRMRTFSSLNVVTGHGSFSIPGPDGNGRYTIRCSCQVHVDDYLGIYNFAEKYGIALDAYNAWDLIPYSFIFDWFFHLGDLLEKSRSRNYALRLSPSVVWFSITHDFVNVHGNRQSDYYRWHCHDLSFMTSLPSSLFETRQASTSTWLKRGADAIALLL